MVKILWIGDIVESTGFGTVTRELLKRLPVDYRVWVLDQYYQGMFIDMYKGNVTLCPFVKSHSIQYYQNTIQPDVTIVYGSYYHLEQYDKFKSRFYKGKTVKYLVVDADPFPDTRKMILESDMLLVPSNYCKRVLEEITDIDVRVVYHGVDTDIFYPTVIRDSGEYIYGTVSTNKWRKMITRILEAYSGFPFDRYDHSLFIYAPVYDPDGYDLPSIESVFKIPRGRVRYSKNLTSFVPLDYEELVQIYQLMNVFVSASSGESFSLPHLEASACARPVITTDLPAIREILGDLPIYVRVSDHITIEWGNLRLCDIDDLREKMLDLYYDRDKGKKIGLQLSNRAREYTWDRAVDQLTRAIEKVL